MRFINKIANLLMAVVILVATTGVTFNKHYCMGELKSVAIFHKAESCMSKMNMPGQACAMNCCQDITEEFKVEDLQKISAKPNLKTNYNLLAVITYVLLDFDVMSTFVKHLKFNEYSPPLIDRDVTILVQSFLI